MSSLTHSIGKIFQPLLDAVGAVLAFFYSIVPNYPIDVALLTIVIMALLTPLTVKSTKNMAAMQALGPEMKKLQQKYKGPENRVQLNEEMMKLYKEHKVNPASGCLPMLLQMPAFFILYSVIRGMTNTVTHAAYTTTVSGLKVFHPAVIIAEPRYIPTDSKMYHNIVAAHGQLISFGMDFSEKLLSHHSSLFVAIPYLLLVVGAVGLQYLQMARLNARNPSASQANPQAAMLQKYMPLIFGFIYLNVAAILNVYFIVSSAIRILTQEILFRKGIVGGPPPAPTPGAKPAGPKGPVVDRTERALPRPKTTGSTAKSTPAKPKAGSNGSNGKSRQRPVTKGAIDAQVTEKPATTNRSTSAQKRTSSSSGNGSGKSTAKTSANESNGSAASADDDESAKAKEHPRSRAKRERKAR
jgi:YidC/Oxa1 family membrane protein insertase